jgi:hypothetical protein
MRKVYPLIPALAAVALARPQLGSLAPGIKAVVPTSAGQIGINTVGPTK